MRFTLPLFVDVLLVLLGTVTALILRDNFELSYARMVALLPYFICTVIAASIVLPAFGVNRAVWRFSAMPDYLRIAAAMLVIVIANVAMSFAYDRLDPAPRALPFLQFDVALILLLAARVVYRQHHLGRRLRRQGMTPLNVVDEPATQTVLLIGLSPLTEAYLQSLAEFAPGRMKVVGILGRSDRHVGRLVASHKVLGLPEHLDRVLLELSIKGLTVDRIVVTAPATALSPAARELIESTREAGVEVRYMGEDLGLELSPAPSALAGARAAKAATEGAVEFKLETREIASLKRRSYWRVKRALDIAGALLLLIAASPLLIGVGLAVIGSVGWPLVFWQQRPGLGGRPFRLLKFRSMRGGVGADGRQLSDDERVSAVGNFLRRSRLDELPQLFNILRGDMSFIGPRPLLPRDQDDAHRARLLVRPGLTGWAQVVGGRAISAADKAALDVWYVRHANLQLDLAILMRTVPMLLVGERTSEGLIREAWRDLAEAGVLRYSFPAMKRVAAVATA
jgi:lipopolysaccharide/colanic/teichoic acid biosynthesis glycosyltransferase